ncbi:TetR/AcrR family transcriptional regulator [Pedobacter arcticus]|uniref:TetR/AcrR family transcriptional regulator n=1 Tax=Pedobacter arcticus TaxID=752140 RepID=UPI0002E805CB|nr:TetR/AcrR family transcriptional regulator [Pedobacter arcticus]
MGNFTDRQIEIIEAATARIDKYGIQNLTIKNLAADIGLSEPALYRHFASKNEILLGLLNYFIAEMKNRIQGIAMNPNNTEGNNLRAIFNSQLLAFTNKPAIVSVIFAESIFHFDDGLSAKVAEIMDLMHKYVSDNIKSGQESGKYSKLIGVSTLTTIIIGSIRLTVLKWKLSGHKSNLLKEGNAVLDGILKMIENKN